MGARWPLIPPPADTRMLHAVAHDLGWFRSLIAFVNTARVSSFLFELSTFISSIQNGLVEPLVSKGLRHLQIQNVHS